jgi:hypothetical protein
LDHELAIARARLASELGRYDEMSDRSRAVVTRGRRPAALRAYARLFVRSLACGLGLMLAMVGVVLIAGLVAK